MNWNSWYEFCCCAVTELCPTLCDPHGLQHARLPCPSPSPGACSNSYPLSWWCHSTILSSVVPFCLQCFPASGSSPVSQFFTSGGQSIGVSVLASVLPMNIQSWFSLGLIGLISCSPRDSQESSPTPQFKSTSSSALSLLYGTVISIHDHWKNHSFDYIDFVVKVTSLLFNMPSRFVIAFLL